MGYTDVVIGNVNLVFCSNTACTASSVVTVDRVPNGGWDMAMTIGMDGNALVTYYDPGDRDLRVVHLSNPLAMSRPG